MNRDALVLVAAVLAVFGVVQLLSGRIVLGLVLIVAACAVGPGGWTLGR